MMYTLGRLAGAARSVRSLSCGLQGDWRFVDQIAGWDGSSAPSVSGTAFPALRRGKSLGASQKEVGLGLVTAV
jgi:hypothetical protein